MAIGQLTVNVAANTPRANKALQALASGVRIVGREGRESGPGLKVVTTGLKAIAAPGAAWAAGKGLTFVGKALMTLSSPRAHAVAGGLKKTAGVLLRIASIVVPGGSLVKLLAAGALVVGVAKTNHELNEMVARLDATGKRADKIGIAVEKLDGLRFAATQTGVETRTLDVALEKMNIRIAEAAKGGGEAVKVLAEMGLSADRLNQLPTEEKFKAIAEALGNYTNKSDKLRIAAKLFEEEGTALVNTMALGSAGIQEMIDKANALGSPTKAMTDAAAGYADASARAEKTWGALADKIATTVLPMKTLVKEASTLVGVLANATFDLGASILSAPGKVLSIGQQAVKDVAVGMATDGDPDGDRAGALTAAQKAQNAAREAKFMEEFNRPTFFNEKLKGGIAGASNLAQQALSRGAQGLGDFQQMVRGAKFSIDSYMREADKRASLGLNPLTGRRPLGMSEARRRLEEGDPVTPAPRVRSVNSLVDATSREGWMALRQNLRGGADESAKAVEKTAENTKRSADLQKESVDALKKIVGFFTSAPPPAKA